MKKQKVLICIVFVALFVLNICAINSFAASSSPIENPDYWLPSVKGDEVLNDKIGVILGTIQVLGVVISVLMLMFIGIKYMLGSAEEKAVEKKAMIPYLVGAVMVFSVTTIPNFIYTLTESFFSEEEYAWITYDCNNKGHEFGIYRDGRCNHFDVCGHRCEHNTPEGWTESTLNGSKTCNTCFWVCNHKTLSSNSEYHYCSTCGGGQASHTFTEIYFCSNYACNYECKHKDDAGNSLYNNGICRCGYECGHNGIDVTYSNLNEDTHTCDRCGMSVAHIYMQDRNDGICSLCQYNCQHDDVIKYDKEKCRCGYVCVHEYKYTTSDIHKCSKCNSERSHDYYLGYCDICKENCKHIDVWWTNGVCSSCKMPCNHTGNDVSFTDIGDRVDHLCNRCQKTTIHTFNKEARDPICIRCGYRCQHTGYWEASDGSCKKCGVLCKHSWGYGEDEPSNKCTVCNYVCNDHPALYEVMEGEFGKKYHVCSVCDTFGEHDFITDPPANLYNYCPDCKYSCTEHNWANTYGICSYCEGSHVHDCDENDQCKICLYICTHTGCWNVETGTCKACKKVCSHTWGNGIDNPRDYCTTCGFTCKHTLYTQNDIGDYHECTKCGSWFNHDWSTKTGECIACKKLCGHDLWTEEDSNGYKTCEICDYICKHMGTALPTDRFYHECGTCGGNIVYHDYNESYCGTCQYTCKHDYGWVDQKCRVCNTQCYHVGFGIEYEAYDAWYHKCKRCGEGRLDHVFVNNERNCVDCGFECTHPYWSRGEEESICNLCGIVCEHNWECDRYESYCLKCDAICNHNSFDYSGKCTKCDYVCSHETLINITDTQHYCNDCQTAYKHEWGEQSGECNICGYKCPHSSMSFSNDIYAYYTCLNCGFKCYHKEYVKVNGEYHACKYCGSNREFHTFSGYNYDSNGNVVCDSCGTRCEHLSYEILSDNQHQCRQCGEISNHSYSSPFGKMVCSVCDNYCGHNAEPTITVDETRLGVHSMWFCGACKKEITGNVNIFMDYNRNNGNVDDLHLYSMVYEEKYNYYTPVLVTKYTIYVNGDEYKTINNDYIAGLGYSESMLVSKFLSTWQKEKGGEIIGAQIYVEGTKKDGTTIKSNTITIREY